MIARAQAMILGGLAAIAIFCAVACLCVPLVVVAAVSEWDDDFRTTSSSIVSRTSVVWRGSLLLSLWIGCWLGRRIGWDWYQNRH